MTTIAERPGAGAVREIAEQFFAARDRFDADAIAELVAEDVTYQMPKSPRSEFSGEKIKSVREFTDSLLFARATGHSG